MDRLLLTLGTLVLAGVVYGLMLRGWRARQVRQRDLPAPALAVPGATALQPAVPGLFVGTTGADHWLDRIAVHHLADRAAGELLVAADGVHVTREALPELFVPWESIEAVNIESSLAGKVVTSGMLVLTWSLGDRRLASAFRATDRAAHTQLLETIENHLSLEIA